MLLSFIIGCKDKSQSNQNVDETVNVSYSEEDLYRPNFHFTPKSGWMNDPNGMFFYNEYYHLYFQHYPDGNTWGPMHWGHAISTDMITWKEQPIAIYPDSLGFIFSGSAVVDVNNVSGFGQDGKLPVIAMYTYHDMEGEKAGETKYQSQAIAYSLNEGQSFTKFSENPVIQNPGIRDFRDPKMVWDGIRKKWVMVLAAGQKIMFYSSSNLKDWALESDFGDGIGSHGGVWECPDFFPMVVQGTDEIKWVLLVSINPGGPNGGSATQYFVGDFDGKQFKVDPSFEKDLNDSEARSIWIDYGRDNYAGVTWANIPDTDGRKLFVGWMSNWDYANVVPTEKWRSAMTIPREITLVKYGNQYRLKSLPIRELQNYVSKVISEDVISITDETVIAKSPLVDFTKLDIQFSLSELKNNIYTFILNNSKGESIEFGLNNKEGFFFIDRSKSGKISFSDKFSKGISKAFLKKDLKNLDVRIILDKTSIELFINDGETVMTEIFFNTQPFDSFSLKSVEHGVEIKDINIKQLKFN